MSATDIGADGGTGRAVPDSRPAEEAYGRTVSEGSAVPGDDGTCAVPLGLGVVTNASSHRMKQFVLSRAEVVAASVRQKGGASR